MSLTQKERSRAHYLKHKDQYLERSKAQRDRGEVAQWKKDNPERVKAHADKHREFKLDYFKQGKECEWCGEDFPDCLDFHHRDPSTKVTDIGFLINRGTLAEIELEISKCSILCSNCHRKLHAMEREGVTDFFTRRI